MRGDAYKTAKFKVVLFCESVVSILKIYLINLYCYGTFSAAKFITDIKQSVYVKSMAYITMQRAKYEDEVPEAN